MSVKDEKELRDLEGKGLHIPAPPGSGPDQVTNLPPSDDIYTGQEYRSSSSGKEEKKESIGKDITILVMITLVAGLLLGLAYGITKEPIAQAQALARAQAQRSVMKDAENFELVYSDNPEEAELIPEPLTRALEEIGIGATRVTQISAAYDNDHMLSGYVVTAVDPDGYGGDVELMCGITVSEDGSMTIEGISFLSLSETAGMGMRAKDETFLEQFSGKQLSAGEQVIFTKNGASAENEIDAISGCTITTSAVTDDVNAALIAAAMTGEDVDLDKSGEPASGRQTEASAPENLQEPGEPAPGRHTEASAQEKREEAL